MSTRVSMSDENVAIFSLYQQDYTDLPAHESDIWHATTHSMAQFKQSGPFKHGSTRNHMFVYKWKWHVNNMSPLFSVFFFVSNKSKQLIVTSVQ